MTGGRDERGDYVFGLAVRRRPVARGGAGWVDRVRLTRSLRNFLIPCSSKSMTVYESSVSVMVPVPYCGCDTRSPFANFATCALSGEYGRPQAAANRQIGGSSRRRKIITVENQLTFVCGLLAYDPL
jgi:hypothetical protein